MGVIVAYALLGGKSLTLKTEGTAAISRSRRIVLFRWCGGLVSLWTPLAHHDIAAVVFGAQILLRAGADPVLATCW
jgi:hypothetical protein